MRQERYKLDPFLALELFLLNVKEWDTVAWCENRSMPMTTETLRGPAALLPNLTLGTVASFTGPPLEQSTQRPLTRPGLSVGERAHVSGLWLWLPLTEAH